MRDRTIGERIRGTRKSVLLLGPRQVGKSTLCRALNPDVSINLADESLFIQYAKDPQRILRELRSIKVPALVVIDEIQRLPSLLNSVQALIDGSDQKIKFVLTGSSARKLKRGGANLLPGRIIQEYLDPLSWFELGSDFDLERALQLGTLPEIYLDRVEGGTILSSYTDVYLREEIQAEALAKDLGSYARFLDVAAILNGRWTNYSKVSSETEIPKETVRRYFSILEETLLVFRLPSFQPKTKLTRKVAQKDRLLFFDVGVRNAILGLHRHPLPLELKGLHFENWLIIQIIYLNRAFKKEWILSSYRTEGGAEVDLVIERDHDIVALEIKWGKNVCESDLRGLQSLEEVIGSYKPLKKRVAYRGVTEQFFKDQDVWVYPYEMVLQQLRDDF